MKNRTSLTLVISLLVCSLTAGAFAQTNPSVLKPEDSTLENRPSDLQPAQEENSNGECPYKVVPGDKVYLQIKNVKLRSDNLPLKPYFQVYGKKGDDLKKISGTWAQDGKQICEKVDKPSSFQFYIDNTYTDICINVYSDYGNLLVANGDVFKTNNLIQLANNPQNKGQTLKLNISKGNNIDLKFVKSKKDRYYYFEIVSYEITNLEKQYIKYFHDSYETTLILNKTEFTPEKIDIGSNSVPLLTFGKKSEALLSCSPNLKYALTAKNSLEVIDTFDLFTNEMVKQLNDCMQKYPDDHTKWVVKYVSKQKSEIELSFAGIQRIYIPTRINIPAGNPARYLAPYAQGKAPAYRFYIEKDGERIQWYNWLPVGWDISFKENNSFEIREGIPANYSIRIFDHNVDMFGKVIHLLDISDISDFEFRSGEITEKIPKRRRPATACKVYFKKSNQ